MAAELLSHSAPPQVQPSPFTAKQTPPAPVPKDGCAPDCGCRCRLPPLQKIEADVFATDDEKMEALLRLMKKETSGAAEVEDKLQEEVFMVDCNCGNPTCPGLVAIRVITKPKDMPKVQEGIDTAEVLARLIEQQSMLIKLLMEVLTYCSKQAAAYDDQLRFLRGTLAFRVGDVFDTVIAAHEKHRYQLSDCCTNVLMKYVGVSLLKKQFEVMANREKLGEKKE